MNELSINEILIRSTIVLRVIRHDTFVHVQTYVFSIFHRFVKVCELPPPCMQHAYWSLRIEMSCNRSRKGAKPLLPEWLHKVSQTRKVQKKKSLDFDTILNLTPVPATCLCYKQYPTNRLPHLNPHVLRLLLNDLHELLVNLLELLVALQCLCLLGTCPRLGNHDYTCGPLGVASGTQFSPA